MGFVLKTTIFLLIFIMTIRIIMNVIDQHGINFVGIFQDIWGLPSRHPYINSYCSIKKYETIIPASLMASVSR
jgi:hypothetical protein